IVSQKTVGDDYPVTHRSTRMRYAGAAGHRTTEEPRLRFLMMMTVTGDQGVPDEATQVEMGRFIEEMSRAGVLLATGGLEPGGTRITSSGGKVTVTDGPFTEAKEGIV